ncbi:RpoS-dependent hydroperoxidase II [Klebsiella grimontii]|uniref:catalase n=1 Tax=Klebsiella grimontii TaxID=2058152 RepID=A0A7H4P5D1_9ENTR|nr:RpoS-dependent hydroperoxidase II [Klebsiella grimontii]
MRSNSLILFIAVKPEPHWAVPQGQSAHDTFWDYVSLQPETLHNVMWAMSDRGLPRSYRTMEGFGIHTFRLINAQGKATFVRFHWKPWQAKRLWFGTSRKKLTGRDPDFHRRDLWEAIEAGRLS